MEQGNNLTRDEARDRAKLVSGVVQEVRFDFTGSGEDYRMETVIGFDASIGLSTPGRPT